MPRWKLNIFVNAIRARMVSEGRTAEEIILEYPALSADERTEILAAI